MKIGDIGRTNCEIEFMDEHGNLLMFEADHLVEVVSQTQSSTDPEDNRYGIVLLDDHGRRTVESYSYDGAWDGLLDPEPAIVRWTPKDSSVAIAQGWDVFCLDGGEAYDLQKCDEDPRFESDEAAWLFVWRRAVEQNDEVAQRALTFLNYRCPEAYDQIRRHCLSRTGENPAGDV